MSPPASQAAGQHDAGPAPLFAEQGGKEDWQQDIQDRLPSLDSLPERPLRQLQASPATTAAAAVREVASAHLVAIGSSQGQKASRDQSLSFAPTAPRTHTVYPQMLPRMQPQPQQQLPAQIQRLAVNGGPHPQGKRQKLQVKGNLSVPLLSLC